MGREEFTSLFLSAIHQALQRAQEVSGRSFPPDFEVELHGDGVSGAIVQFNEAANRIYLDGNIFHPIIDVGLREVRKNRCIVFVRVSPQRPVSFEKTWNTPTGNGPFKIIEPYEVKFAD